MMRIEHNVKGRGVDVFGTKLSDQRAETYYVESGYDLIHEEMPDSNRSEWLYKLNLRRSGGWFDKPYFISRDVMKHLDNLEEPLWKPAVEKQKYIKAPLNKKAVARETKRRRKRIRGEFGNEVNIHEVMQGRLDRAWTRTIFEDREVMASKHVTLLVNCSISAMITPEQVQWQTAAMLQIHDELIRMGKSVEISLYWSLNDVFTDNKGPRLTFFYIPIKTSGQSLSTKHLATYSSASYRRLITLNRMFNLAGRPVRTGYGHPVSSHSLIPYPAQKMRDEGHHVVVLSQCFSQSAAEDAVEKVIQQVKDKDATPQDMTAKQLLGA